MKPEFAQALKQTLIEQYPATSLQATRSARATNFLADQEPTGAAPQALPAVQPADMSMAAQLLTTLFGVTARTVGLGAIQMGQSGNSRADDAVIWTKALGGCQGIFVHDGSSAYGSHLVPQLDLTEATAPQKAREILKGCRGATVTIVSKSIDVPYFVAFAQAFLNLGVPASNLRRINTDCIAMEPATGRIVTAFRVPDLSAETGAGSAYNDVQGW